MPLGEIKYLDTILQRDIIKQDISSFLDNFENTWKLNTSKKGIYIYGQPGSGKTYFITEILKRMNYDIIVYNAGDVRNKALFQTIDCNNVSNRNVLDLMSRKIKKIAILMDEIDGMNNGDKGGIDALIKLIRQKKTKKQKNENTTLNPIICIGNHESDKKIRELMKACHVFELKSPTHLQISQLLTKELPPYDKFSPEFKTSILQYIQGDLRKVNFLLELWQKKPEMVTHHTLKHIFHVKISNEDAKHVTMKLLKNPIPLCDHNIFMNETDRTTISLIWHENIGDQLSHQPIEEAFPFYCQILDNMCFADYIGRITFQSQIWQFNEMTSLIKTFYNNRLFHDKFKPKPIVLENIEFTKVLTKYSTEYNNQLFLQSLCSRMTMDKKDVVCFFQELRCMYGDLFYMNSEKMGVLDAYFQKDEMDSLDIKRIYRFLDKNVKKEDVTEIYESDDECD